MPIGIYPRTEKHFKIMSKAMKGKKNHLGHKHSAETKRIMSEIKKGKHISPSTEFKKGHKINLGRHHSEETKLKISIAHKNMSIETRHKISESHKLLKGEKSVSWKGGVTPVSLLVRHSLKHKLWREAIFKRDNWTCKKCNKRGEYLEAHHLKRFNKLVQEAIREFPLLSKYDACMLYQPLWDIDNGITFCRKCHDKTKGRTIKD